MAKYIKTEEGYKDLEESVSKIVDPVKAELSNKISNKMNTSNPTGAGYFSMNRKTGTTIGQYSHAEGYDTTANASYSHAEGYNTIARGNSSHAEGCGTMTNASYSHAEGYGTIASGNSSHAEGDYTTASGNSSHAEGDYTTASGNFSHAEGSGTKASEYSSHAEGSGTKASGSSSHAEGDGTTASSDYQHVQGKYNIADTSGTYAHIVGNGTPGAARSNAHTLDWNGNAWYQGDVYVGGTNQTTGSKKLATEEYVNEAIPDLSGFATKDEIPVVPEALPNPNALTFTGAVNATYDGSSAVSVEIPSGGSGGGEDPAIVYDTVLTEEVGLVEITEDRNGNPFNLKSLAIVCIAVGTSSNTQNGYGNIYINGDKFLSSQDNFTRQSGVTRTNLTLSIYNKYFRVTSVHYKDKNVVNENGYFDCNLPVAMNFVNNNSIYRIIGFTNEQSNIAQSFKIKCDQNTVFGVGSRIIIYDLG